MKNNREIRQIDITELKVDAIVNATNSGLQEGGGVCGAIFQKAGPAELRDACSEIGGCRTGDAVITPGFNLPARYVIHAVGPIWKGGDDNEAEKLYSAYERSLTLAKENDCRSIAFPLISSGIYGYPKNQAWQIALKACSDFVLANPDWPVKIIFAVLSGESKMMGEKAMEEI